MKSISKVMLLSTSFLFRFEAAYALADADAFPAFQRDGTHTHYTTNLAPYPHLSHPREAGAASPHRFAAGCSVYKGGAMLTSYPPQKMEQNIRVASVCFITDTGACRDLPYDIPDYNICVEEGFPLTSCPEFYTPYNYCPYDNKYFAECREMCPDYVECNDPYYGVGEPCNGKYERCECDTCPGYVFESEIPRGYHKVGEACNSCDGPKYKYEINSCDGFMECLDTGPEEGAEVCWRGDTPTYSSCKPCANLGDLDSCPAHYVCKYEDCSKKYYKTGCEEGYIWDEAAKTCTPECDPNDRTCQCPGKHYCDPDTKVGDGKTCTTEDGTTYYDRCLVKETCFDDDTSTHYKAHITDKGICQGSGWTAKYPALFKCTNQQGKSFYYDSACYQDELDCAGNVPPCRGYKLCNNGPALGATPCPVKCGTHDPVNNPQVWTECDSCVGGDWNENGGRCAQWGNSTAHYGDKSYTYGESLNNGWYYVKDKCTVASTGLTYFGVWSCNQNMRDCTGKMPPCSGYKDCDNPAVGAKTCECGGTKLYSECDICQYNNQNEEGCSIQNEGVYEIPEDPDYGQKKWGDRVSGYWSWNNGKRADWTGIYFVKYGCTSEVEGRKYQFGKACNDTTPDCTGKIPPCAGMLPCGTGKYTNLFGVGEECSCGGTTYFKDCASECTFEETAETCAAKGQSFEQKCYGSKNGQQVWFGECK